MKKLKPKQCKDKLLTVSKYKFVLCFENVSWPGYVTEKIIDCLVAGTIPIYLGANDIDQFVPRGVFIDQREFSSNEQLYKYIESMSEADAMKIINAGTEFLRSAEGLEFSYEWFAEKIAELVLQEGNT